MHTEIEVDVHDKNFEKEVIEKSKKVPVLVDFWASWCSPCLMLKPILEKVAKDYKGKLILAKINVDENQKISEKFSIMSIPSVKLFKNGKIADGFVGALPESRVREFIDRNLK